MNTTSLINLTAEETGQTKEQTAATLEAALKIIRGTVASGEAVELLHFGAFYTLLLCDKDERKPPAGYLVDDVRVVKFSPAEAFRKAVNHRS
jgi:nucleoid DNA-binding protein